MNSSEQVTQEESEQTEDEIELGKNIIEEDTKLKIVPVINATETIEVKKDEEVNVTEIINGWVCVETQNTKGWIRKEKILTKAEQEKIAQEEQAAQEAAEQQAAEEQAQNSQKTMYVNASTVNVRREPSTSSEIVTNATLNTEVVVQSQEGGWSKVTVNGRDGYIATNLLSSTRQTTSRSSTTRRTTTTQSSTQTQNTTSSTTTTTQTTSGTSSGSSSGAAVVAKAKSYIGYKYVYGGSSPSTGFDCSGFTSYIYKQFGVSLNRTAAGQYSNGTAVSRANLQPGDLVMFGKSGINHVGIYIGGGMIVHAENSSTGVTTDTINSGYYNNNYVGARRIF